MKFNKVLISMLLALLVGAGGLSRAEVLARVGSDKIDDVEFNAKVAAEERAANRKFSAEERQGVLQALINQRLLVALAHDEKLDKKDEVRRTLEDSERQVLANLVYDQEVASKVKVSDAEVRDFYDKNPQLFELREVSQILIQPASASQGTEAAKKADGLAAKARAHPKSFAALARAESDDKASKAKGGDLGELRQGMLVKELEGPVFSAKPGAVLGPIQTRFGFHILFVRSSKQESFDDAKGAIAKEIGRAKAADLQQRLLLELGKKFKVSISKDK